MSRKDPIYMPEGSAAEYSTYALNVYMKCAHCCDYCYNRRFHLFDERPEPRPDIVGRLDRQLQGFRPDAQVMLSFMGDPYGPAADGNAATHAVLLSLLEHRAPVAILTKAGRRCLRDADVFRRFGRSIQVGASLTFDDARQSAMHEPGAAPPSERIDALRQLHAYGIRTFASLEPVYDPYQTLELIRRSRNYVDAYMIGALTQSAGYGAWDWAAFARRALAELEGRRVYLKDSIAAKLGEGEVGELRESFGRPIRDPWECRVSWEGDGA